MGRLAHNSRDRERGREGGGGNGTKESRQFEPPSPGENAMITLLRNSHIFV